MRRFLVALLFLLLAAGSASAQQGFNNGGINTCAQSGPFASLQISLCYGYLNGVPTFFEQQPAGGTSPLVISNLPNGADAISINSSGNGVSWTGN